MTAMREFTVLDFSSSQLPGPPEARRVLFDAGRNKVFLPIVCVPLDSLKLFAEVNQGQMLHPDDAVKDGKMTYLSSDLCTSLAADGKQMGSLLNGLRRVLEEASA